MSQSRRSRAPNPPDNADAGTGLRWAARIGALLLLGAAAALAVASGWHRALTLENLVQRRAELTALVNGHYAAMLVAFVAIYLSAVALSVPGAVLLTIGGGMLFGWFIGGLAAVVGATAGATLLFLIARFALADFVRRRAGPRLGAISEGFRADAFSYLLFLRLVPIFPFWLVNLAPALAGVGLPTFVAATFLGIIPATFAFAAFGAGLDSAVAAQEAVYRSCQHAARTDCRLDLAIGAALTPQLVAALTALGIMALIPPLLKRWRARRQAARAADATPRSHSPGSNP